MTTKTKEVEEIQYFRRMSSLYEKAAPIIGYIAAPEFLKRGLLPVSPRSLVESNITLQMVLQAVKKLPKPQNKLLMSVERDFETALLNCIKAAEASEKFIDLTDYHRDGLFFGQIINAAVLAHEYIESVRQKLADFEGGSKKEVEEPVKTAEIKQKSITGAKILRAENNIQTRAEFKQTGASVVEKGLDKLGDAIIYFCDRIRSVFASILKKSNFKKTSN